MDQGIKFVITGDTKGLEKATEKAKKEVDELGDSVEGTSGKVDQGSEAVEQLGESSEKAGDGVGSLSQELASMATTTGVVTLIVTTAIALFTQLEEDTGLLSEALTGLSRQQQLAADRQRELNEAVAEGVGSAEAEIFTLKALVDIARDDARSRAERQNAINRINQEYPDLLENLTLEEIGSDETRAAIDRMTESLERQAKIRALTESLTQALSEQQKILRTSSKDAATFTDRLVASFTVMSSFSGTEFEEELARLGELGKAEDFFGLDETIASLKEQLRRAIEGENLEVPVKVTNGTTPDDLEKIRKEFIRNQEKITREQERELAKRTADAEREANRQAAILKRVNAQLWAEEQDAAELAANEITTAVAEIYRDSGAQAADLLRADEFQKQADAAEAPILQMEEALEGLKKTLDSFGLEEIDLSGLSTGQLDALAEKLDNLAIKSQVFGDAIGASFQAAASEISSALATGNTVIDAFTSSIISSLATLAASYLANELFGKALAQKLILTEQSKSNANAITIASSAAAAAGPAGIFLFPGFLATMLAQINGAFAGVQAIGAFAQGGIVGGGSFTGDQILARLNSGERVLTLQDQGLLTRFLRGETMGTTNQTGGLPDLEAATVLRGSDIYLSWRRTERNNKRFY